MQKLLKRTAQAERQVSRRLAASTEKTVRSDRRERMTAQRRMRGALYRDLHASRQARARDWDLGPLAPRRDVGALTESFGAASEDGRQRGVNRHVLPRELREERCSWLGGCEDLNLVVGDRVAVIEGLSKGRVGKVSLIDAKSAEVQLEDVSQVCNGLPCLIFGVLHLAFVTF